MKLNITLAHLAGGGQRCLSRALASVLMCTMLGACAQLSYYAQSINGHLSLLQAARPIDDWLHDPAAPETLKQRLREVREIRRYASMALGLPDNSSYQSYAELDRPFVVWNVVATPELSLKMKQWCFPVAGCVDYRGYYNKEEAEAYAASLRSEAWDVHVGGVRAYSTLGWTSDPLLSTFIHFPEGEVARLIFHELSHQLLYVPGDSTFNESFSTAFEQEALRRWLATRGDARLEERYRLFAARKNAYVSLLRRHRLALETDYSRMEQQPSGHAQARHMKRARFDALKAEYVALKEDPLSPLFGFSGYDRFFEGELNNSHLASVATYTQMVPAFDKLLRKHNGDLQKFLAAARELAALPGPQRRARMASLSSE